MDNILRKRINVKRDNVAPYKLNDGNGYSFRSREKAISMSSFASSASTSRQSGSGIKRMQQATSETLPTPSMEESVVQDTPNLGKFC